ncbi:MAG: tRNA uridine-5-carboxymethylaminomethyl(34) synthesis GTPase MnmE [Oligoflexia bacterium]|nr:tRNA uridine-5-carboxymethylaminomethyl(34) synthesis GTPase MnmE [Oligoflexia bacterium]
MASAGYFNQDTIASIITSPNAFSPVGLIRLSGISAFSIARTIASRSFNEKIKSHFLYRTSFIDSKEEVFDEGLIVFMRAPNSFTGEDVVELHFHGNPYVLSKAISLLIQNGARQSLPGEFSFRAFRNGKISLDQAEGISSLIASTNEYSAQRSFRLLQGNVKEGIQSLRDQLERFLMEVEMDIDFSDQDLSVIDFSSWSNGLKNWVDEVRKIREDFLKRKPLLEGVKLAFIGEPNSGKSSLFNRLLGMDRSIVSDEAGTTRDTVKESIIVGDILFRITDTAGLREGAGYVESKGIEKSLQESKDSDLILFVVDASVLEKKADSMERTLSLIGVEQRSKIKILLNKIDLVSNSVDFLKNQNSLKQLKIPIFAVSALTGEGFDQFLGSIQENLEESDGQGSFEIGRMRHFEVLGKAIESVQEAILKVDRGEKLPDLLSADLRLAVESLGEITGEFSNDDMLNRIFSSFCIGK